MASKGRGWDSIVGILRRWAIQSANKVALVYESPVGGDPVDPPVSLRYEELDLQARAIAASLQEAGLSGRTVLILCQGISFVTALNACFYAGVIAVPCNQPRAQAKHWQRLRRIIKDAELGAIIGEYQYLATVKTWSNEIPELKDIPLLAVETLASGDADRWRDQSPGPDQLALLQYTSGSTGHPKGVMVSHANLVHNLRLIQLATLSNNQSTMVSWLPLFHDMGLMGGLLTPLFMGARTVLMPPTDFIQQPSTWLSLMSKYQATTSGGPNFAFAYATERIPQKELEGLDLSYWRAAFCGAEPVMANTLQAFADRFASIGFKASSLLPCYGLAENTLIVTGRVGTPQSMTYKASRNALKQGRFEPPVDHQDEQALVCCGQADEYMSVVIADPQTCIALGEDRVGEIWIKGGSVAQGYWHDAAATAARFNGWLKASGNSTQQVKSYAAGPYLRTGDLGIIHQGELFITGRLKDLIIIRGRNYYPHDIEFVLGQEINGISKHALVAVSISNNDYQRLHGNDQDLPVTETHWANNSNVSSLQQRTSNYQSERLVIIAELDRHCQQFDFDAIYAAIRSLLIEQFEVSTDDIVLISPGSILRTTSGKIRRADMAQQYIRDELAVIAKCEGSNHSKNHQHAISTAVSRLSRITPVTTNEQSDRPVLNLPELQTIVAQSLMLRPEQIVIDKPLTALGLDSLKAALLCTDLYNTFGIKLGITELIQASDLSKLYELMSAKGRGHGDIEYSDRIRQRRLHEPELTAQQDIRHQAFALTDMQQAYWLGRSDIFELGQRSLHAYLELDGDIRLDRFEWAWNCLINKHDMLRAVIDEHGRQRVLQKVPEYQLTVQDLSALSEQEQNSALLNWREELSHQCLNLHEWPAFDIRASSLGKVTRLHLSIDGLFLDLRSFQLLFQELLALYHGLEWQSEAPALSFQDYVINLERRDESHAYKIAQRFWRNRLPNLAPSPHLPLAKDPTQINDAPMRRREYRLSESAWQSIASFAAEQGITTAAVLLTAYGKVLARWSQEQALSINVPLFNRPSQYPELTQVIGNFSTFTLVAMDFSVPRSFIEEAREVQHQLHQAIEHSQVSGVEILRELARQRGQVSGRAFPIVFTHLPTGLNDWDDSLLAQMERGFGELAYAITQTPQVWLDNQIWYEKGGLRLHWDGLDELFPPGMVDEMFAAYTGLLEQLSASRQHWRSRYLNLLPSWQDQLFAVANMTQQDLPTGVVIDWIAAKAQRNPRALAIVNGNVRMSYGELLMRADQLAQVLHQRGLGRGHRVALLLEKGWRQIVAVLGAQRCGATYIPLDVTNPPNLIEQLINDCSPDIVITEDKVLSHRQNIMTRYLSIDAEEVSAASAQAPRVPRQLDDLAYMIYTSGTTGAAKAVMVTQYNLASLVAMTNRHFDVTSHDRLLALTAIHHDLSVFDIFAVLSAGACLIIPEVDQHKDPGHWLTLIQEESVSLWNSVPALLQMMLDYVSNNELLMPPSLRQAWIGGDWVSAGLVNKARRMAPQMQFCSIGGPTETTVWNIWYPVTDNHERMEKIPYGKPAPNNRYYVLNHAGEDCPVWVTGELYCAGNGVALGYWQKPAETAYRFVPHPRTGERLYRCGDQGRWLPDGNIEFMGRSDHQIKVQGVRIETGEVEAALVRHCDLDAAVVGTTGEGIHKTLTAWVVPIARNQQSQSAKAMLEYTGPVISDPLERTAFKLERRGIRDLPGERIGLAHCPDEANKSVYLQRQSIRRFAQHAIPFEDFSAWLSCLAALQLQGQLLPKYRYPSGGGLYPVQAYLYLRAGSVEGLAAGYYYYDAKQHELVRIGSSQAEPALIPTAQAMCDVNSFNLWLVGDLDAIEPLYGRLARDFCMLEAGYMGQLLMAQASEHLLGLCAMGYSDQTGLQQQLGLERKHLVLHGMVGGAIQASQLEHWLSEESPQAQARLDAISDQLGQNDLTRIIQQRLAEYLPPALVPQRIFVLKSLPLTRNGKLDRQALLNLALSDQESATTQTQDDAQTDELSPLQQTIAAIWCETLNLQQVGLDENFFTLGGNSNLLVQIHSKIQCECHQEFAVATLFKYPTVRQFAQFLSSDDKDSSVAETDERGRRQREALRRQRQRKATRYV